jgi:hypothetical protein
MTVRLYRDRTPNSIIGDRNQLAVALLVALPLMNYLRVHSAHRAVRIGLLISMGADALLDRRHQSRGALVGLVATGLSCGCAAAASSFLALFSASRLPARSPYADSWVERMRTIETFEEDRSAMGRVEIWMAAFEIARK